MTRRPPLPNDAACDGLSAGIADSAAHVVERYSAFASAPDDPETNHKLRVSIRKLRSLLSFLEPWHKRSQGKPAQKALRHIVRETSRLRELDVLAIQAAESGLCGPSALRVCASAAAEERARVLQAYARSGADGMLRGVRDALDPISWKARVEDMEPGQLGLAVRDRYRSLARELESALGQLSVADYEAVHDVRKRAKQLRYACEEFGGLLDDDADAVAEKMKSRQDHLGALCDAHVNLELIPLLIARDDADADARASLSKLLDLNREIAS